MKNILFATVVVLFVSCMPRKEADIQVTLIPLISSCDKPIPAILLTTNEVIREKESWGDEEGIDCVLDRWCYQIGRADLIKIMRLNVLQYTNDSLHPNCPSLRVEINENKTCVQYEMNRINALLFLSEVDTILSEYYHIGILEGRFSRLQKAIETNFPFGLDCGDSSAHSK